jgi:predicted NBD/HSP70 family sugar kinase
MRSTRTKRSLPAGIRTATPASVRQVNRAIVLNLIRIHQPVSRIQLSELTGIYRSNVSFIVEELLAERIVREQRSEDAVRGRTPMMLSLNSEAIRLVAVSIRVTATTVALADLNENITGSLAFPTPSEPQAWVNRFRAALDEIVPKVRGRRVRIHQICVSVPGMVDQATGSLLWMNALPRYTGFALRSVVEQLTAIPIVVANDCHLAAANVQWLNQSSGDLGELAFLEVGDIGVGGGLIVNGRLSTGHNATFAGELGHMVIDRSGPLCNCGRRGCWELFVCDRATWSRYDRRRPYTAARFADLLAAAHRHEPKALACFRETAACLAVGISNIVMLLNPKVVILAGRIAEVWDIIEEPLRNGLRTLPSQPEVRPAHMPAEEFFLRGAISRAVSGLFAKPELG